MIGWFHADTAVEAEGMIFGFLIISLTLLISEIAAEACETTKTLAVLIAANVVCLEVWIVGIFSCCRVTKSRHAFTTIQAIESACLNVLDTKLTMISCVSRGAFTTNRRFIIDTVEK